MLAMTKVDFMNLPLKDSALFETVGQRYRMNDNEPVAGNFVEVLEVADIVEMVCSDNEVYLELKLCQIV